MSTPTRASRRPRTALPPPRRAPGPAQPSRAAGGPRKSLQDTPQGVQIPSSATEILLQADLSQWYVRTEWELADEGGWLLTVAVGRRQTPAEAQRRPGPAGRWLYTMVWSVPWTNRGRWLKTRSRYQAPAMRPDQTVQIGSLADVLQAMRTHPTPIDLR